MPLAIATSSCDKEFLDKAPKTSISDANAFATPDRVLAIVNGVYDGLKSGQYLGGRYLVYADIRGEEFIVNKPNGVTGLDTWGHNVNSGTNEVINLWSAVYTTINRANILIKGMEENPTVVSAALNAQYIAEAKFVRALCYFDLLQFYAKPYTSDAGASPGVPLRLQAETNAVNNDLARSTVATVYAQIIKDLDEAEAALPITHGNATLNISRAHKNTAVALKTRVYLSMGNYPKVVSEAAKIVTGTTTFQAPATTGVNNKLEADVTTVFGGSYTGAEALFSMIMTDLDAPGTQNGIGFYFNYGTTARPGGNAEYYLNPAGIVANPVYSAASTDNRKKLVEVFTGASYVTKYKKASPFTDYVPIIRYSEVLLNYAEAAARTGDLPKAIALLNAVRTRSDAAYIFPAAALLPTEIVNTILTERRIELVGEGFRAMDIMRLGQTFPAKAGTQNAPAVAPAAQSYIWPISSQETQTNTLL